MNLASAEGPSSVEEWRRVKRECLFATRRGGDRVVVDIAVCTSSICGHVFELASA